MTFEEDFPSLKVMWDIGTKKNIFYREEVQEHCLDKQKVRDAIDKQVWIDSPHGWDDFKNDLKKEIGL